MKYYRLTRGLGDSSLQMSKVLNCMSNIAKFSTLYWEGLSFGSVSKYRQTLKTLEPDLLGIFKTTAAYGYQAPSTVDLFAEPFKLNQRKSSHSFEKLKLTETINKSSVFLNSGRILEKENYINGFLQYPLYRCLVCGRSQFSIFNLDWKGSL